MDRILIKEVRIINLFVNGLFLNFKIELIKISF